MKNNWQKNAGIFLLSQAFSLLGSSIVQLAIIWHVTLTTSSGTWVTVLTLCSFIPQVLIAPMAGVWADRYNKKIIIILSDGLIAIATICLFILLKLADTDYHLFGIILISSFRSLGSGIHSPAINATIPRIVPAENLSKFNGINSSLQSMIQFISPAVSGIILSFASIKEILLIDILTAMLAILLLLLIKVPVSNSVKVPRNSFTSDLKKGFRTIKENIQILKLFKNYALFIFLSVPSGFLVALFVERNFKKGYFALSTIELVGFLGMFLGGLAFAFFKSKASRISVFSCGMLLYGLVSTLLGTTVVFWQFCVWMFFTSFFIPIIQSSMMTFLQENVPLDIQGRVFSVLSAIYSSFMPLGMLVFGLLSDQLSLRWLFVFCGAGIFLLGFRLYQIEKNK